MCFKEWMLGYIRNPDPVGDLAREIYSDKKFPAVGTYFEILWHIGKKTDFNWYAVNLFIEAWNVYEQVVLV